MPGYQFGMLLGALAIQMCIWGTVGVANFVNIQHRKSVNAVSAERRAGKIEDSVWRIIVEARNSYDTKRNRFADRFAKAFVPLNIIAGGAFVGWLTIRVFMSFN